MAGGGRDGKLTINELCLTLLVAIWHNVERELVWISARVTRNGRELDGEQYEQRVQEERKQLRGRNGWEKITAKLRLEGFARRAEDDVFGNCRGFGNRETILQHPFDMHPNSLIHVLLRLFPRSPGSDTAREIGRIR